MPSATAACRVTALTADPARRALTADLKVANARLQLVLVLADTELAGLAVRDAMIAADANVMMSLQSYTGSPVKQSCPQDLACLAFALEPLTRFDHIDDAFELLLCF